MSRSLGANLPDGLLDRLATTHPVDPLGRAVVLATVDPYGWPHPALVSDAELLAFGPNRLRLALRAGTRSATHLRDAGRATLVFADAGLALYVKVEAVPIPPADDLALARFELHVRDVLEDRAEGEEAGARLTGGIRFEWPGGSEAWARHAARLRQLLQS